MATKRKSRKSGTKRRAVLGKPNGIIQPRVQAVGPERFGIVAVDCAKARSKWMLCDFYGRVPWGQNSKTVAKLVGNQHLATVGGRKS